MLTLPLLHSRIMAQAQYHPHLVAVPARPRLVAGRVLVLVVLAEARQAPALVGHLVLLPALAEAVLAHRQAVALARLALLHLAAQALRVRQAVGVHRVVLAVVRVLQPILDATTNQAWCLE